MAVRQTLLRPPQSPGAGRLETLQTTVRPLALLQSCPCRKRNFCVAVLYYVCLSSLPGASL